MSNVVLRGQLVGSDQDQAAVVAQLQDEGSLWRISDESPRANGAGQLRVSTGATRWKAPDSAQLIAVIDLQLLGAVR